MKKYDARSHQLTSELVLDLCQWLDERIREDNMRPQLQSALRQMTARYRLLLAEPDDPLKIAQADILALTIARVGFAYADEPGYVAAWRPDGW